ncbi:MAG TPA: MGMT family protein [Cyclobacteriaceae bacterium]|jgi:methylated-DNA-protein-cysteine methyltransferase-like protein|nr:MGMT family protein [Cyclobacteriaceae bacterium]
MFKLSGVNLARSNFLFMPVKEKNDKTRNFFADVYEVVKLIPKGRVTSYGAIAHYLGTKGSARMVGWAMYGCPKGVPAHRVVNSAGLLTGKHHFKTPDTMEKLLKKEGVEVLNNKIRHFKELMWNPSIELL